MANRQGLLPASDITWKPLNYDKYKDLETELTQEGLIQFISSIGKSYKAELVANLTALYAEKANVDNILLDHQQALQAKEQRTRTVGNQKKNDEDRIKRLLAENETLKTKIVDKKEQLQDKLPFLQKLIDGMEVSKKDITADGLKKVYQFLEKRTAEPVAFVMEALVGLMRNMKRADTKSVELYIIKYEGFMIGLNRINVKKLNFEYLNENLTLLRDKYNVLLNSEEFEIFRPFRKILAEICQVGLVAKDVAHIEDNIAKKEEQIHQNLREIDKLEIFLKGVDVAPVVHEDFQAYNSHQMTLFVERQKHIDEQIGKVTQKLRNFDQEFFAGL